MLYPFSKRRGDALDTPPKHYWNGDGNNVSYLVSYVMPHSLIHAPSFRSDRPKIVNLPTI